MDFKPKSSDEMRRSVARSGGGLELQTIDCPGGFDRTQASSPPQVGLPTGPPPARPAGAIFFTTCFYSREDFPGRCRYSRCCIEWQLNYQQRASTVTLLSRLCMPNTIRPPEPIPRYADHAYTRRGVIFEGRMGPGLNYDGSEPDRPRAP